MSTSGDLFDQFHPPLGRGFLHSAEVGGDQAADRRSSEQLVAACRFTKRDDLAFFLREVCDAKYVHEPLLAPEQPMLDAYKKERGDWALYASDFLALMAERHIETRLAPGLFRLFERPSVLLCSEHTPEHCHRRLYFTISLGEPFDKDGACYKLVAMALKIPSRTTSSDRPGDPSRAAPRRPRRSLRSWMQSLRRSRR